ncbi:hypothetical protein N7540_011056 [Penicillium herquei]|nr:hypothetical protein N7540_011056 [Penicillium herquei]
MRRVVSPRKIHGSILKNRERTSSHRDKSEERPLKRVHFEPVPQGSLKESVCGPGKKTASWSVPNIAAAPTPRSLANFTTQAEQATAPDEQRIRRRGGLSPQIVKSHDDFEALAIEVKSLKRELELMRSSRMNAGISEGR